MATSPTAPTIRVSRTVTQICRSDGEPFEGYATQYVWVSEADAYPKTDGNIVTPLLSGETYFQVLAEAIAHAQSTIYILGWQINWDVWLTPNVRLYDAIRTEVLAKPALKVYVLPWDDSAPLNTLDDETVAVMRSINKELGKAPRVFAQLAKERPDSSGGLDMFFSHHQKQVVIDEKVVFMGGLDLAYGRRDSATYPLDGAGRLGMDMYNGCAPALTSVEAGSDYIHGTDVKTNADISATTKVELPTGGAMLDARRQPRMPWQDIHLKIEGPAVSDLCGNFVLRWNMAREKAELKLPPPPEKYPNAGTCSVQMLRSASRVMVDLESKYASKVDKTRVHAKSGHNHIHHAMVRLIENAEHFIYIENQFFVSAFGKEQFFDDDTKTEADVDSRAVHSVRSATSNWATSLTKGAADAPPSNLICEALGEKLRDVILNAGNPAPDGKQSNFHVYITLPVHPEGSLGVDSIMAQVHYTMQTLVFGTQSLLNRIRRAIKARQLRDKNDDNYERAFNDGNTEYRSVSYDYCWPYVTLLNLRNWSMLEAGENACTPQSTRYVTEQIYIHSKMMVVDDRFAIVGSANVNDRSQLGNRDSELAVLVMDTDFNYTDVGDQDGLVVTRKFARELRMGVWNKIFGNTGGERPAGLEEAIEKPAAQRSWERIRQQAEDNTKAYEAAFPYIPRNGAKIWPTVEWTADSKARASGLMPFDAAFWDAPQHRPEGVAGLQSIKGYITLLPWLWTKGENNNNGMHSALLVNNNVPTTTPKGAAVKDTVQQASVAHKTEEEKA